MGQENSLLQKLDFVWLKLHVTEIEATGSVERRQGSGTKRTVSTRGNIESVQELVLRQDIKAGYTSTSA